MRIDILKTGNDLEKAFLEFNEFIYRYIFIRVGYRKEIAEDLAQDVFVKAWKNRDQFNAGKSSMKNWLFVIARSTLIDYFRKSKNEFVPINVFEIADTGFEDKLIDSLTFKEVVQKLDLLKDHEKDLLVLRYVEDLDIKEIAKLLNKSLVATKVSIHRALQKLKKLTNRP